jgi:octaprenyl-diphosphate synthase
MLVAYSGWEGGGEREALVRLGAVIELVHLATLVHDDILDGADTRHRQETAAAKFGAGAAVLIGDALFSHALKLAAEFPTTEVCRRVARATARVCAGEISQTYRRGEYDGDRERYFREIELKTAELFDVSCRLGAAVGGYPEDFCRAAGVFGRHLGRAYQIFDDLADLYASEEAIGKTLGTDLAKGKFTLPLIVLLERVSPAERESLLTAFRSEAAETAGRFGRSLREQAVFGEVAEVFEKELGQAENALRDFREIPPAPRLLSLAKLVRVQLARIDHREPQG